MRNLFEIQQEYIKYLDELEEYFRINPDTDGEIPEDINERLSINKNEIEEKLTNFYLWKIETENNIEALKIRRDQLSARIKSKTKTIERIKKYMEDAVRLYGDINLKSKAKIPTKTVEGTDVKFTFIYTPKIEVVNIDLVPQEYTKYNIEVKNIKPEIAEKIYKFIKDTNEELEINAIQNIDKKLIEPVIEETSIEGLFYNKEEGYIRTS